MKKPIFETVRLDKIVGGGQALGVLGDGKKVFVWGGLPVELVKIEITKNKSRHAEGIVTKVIESAEQRIAPRDDCYLSTSPWQIMDYDFELAQKADLVQQAFAMQGIENLPSKPIVTDGAEYFYRNKMEYSLWWDNDSEQISLAFHRRGSHQKVPIIGSSIERPEILREARRIVDELNARGEQARRYQSLVVRCNQSGKVSSALFENGKPHPLMQKLSDELLGRTYTYSPNGFFQINLPLYEMALRDIARHLGDAEKVVDMYAGVGTIGLSVARERSLTLVETNTSCFQEMSKNIPVGAHNITPVCSKSEEALEYITNNACVIVDPPRAGLDSAVTQKLADAAPPTIIYLSCNPVTQARDIAKLLPKYKVSHAQGFNFFPRTPHIENLVVLNKVV
ncbi:MAG: RsmD family RNA methyltransferase [Candidatus Nomurabacteria bacterium]|jgi:23S rRNA (uracil1939-C5)-methyltransferase|nr:RsmD family RNA methyltransferase [Candidatus Nomurabacteria bacterium]